MSRKLFIDAQIFQTPAWHRGMGKYSLELLAAIQPLLVDDGWAELSIILSSKLPTSPSMINLVNQRLQNPRIIYLDLLPNEADKKQIQLHNRKVIDKYINSFIDDEDNIYFLILALMQSEIYPTFPLNPEVNKLIIFYDVVPLIFHGTYLGNLDTRTKYLEKFTELLKADLVFTISNTVAKDLELHLGIDRGRIINIDGGPIDHDKIAKIIKVPRPFILMPTGNDLRKNNKRAIIAFDKFNQQHKYKYTLVVTSFFNEQEISKFKSISNNLIFTGNISGSKLRYLYKEAEAILFPTEYEGLGLPILEAMEFYKPIACSNIAVFKEISPDAFNYFDPYSDTDIKEALAAAIDTQSVDKKAYEQILEKYQWRNTARKMINATIAIHAPTKSMPKKSTKLAIFGPDPSRNRTGEMMQLAHAELSRIFDTTYYIRKDNINESQRVNYLPYIAKVLRLDQGLDFESDSYSNTLYYIDNHEASSSVLFAALSQPGIIILGDIKLGNTWLTMVEQDLIDRSRLDLEKTIEKLITTKGAKYLGSLLAAHKIAIVFGDKQKIIVEAIGQKVNRDLTVFNIDADKKIDYAAMLVTLEKNLLTNTNINIEAAHG